ncbi:HesB/YadR/YfhF family protein [Halobacillus amylolyticus]|uniref:HesB/YadR/YfhF family protein n=1 Tax=Halobacillus amylolyticus TaxID=2932259 RepID=A0ABY4HCZ5_9BACI|nr:HesB/YadR/YfhF family protein [Halobacillus amylolyticus]UOR12599.1 HesB/YadR/YfhF family protein [Halobacillus amylolyticus]
MNLHVTEAAAKWYENELDIEGETSIRFYVRYGGVGGLQPGFSLAIREDVKQEPIASTKVNQIEYFVEEDDEWYFDNLSLKVLLNEKWDEPEFEYE